MSTAGYPSAYAVDTHATRPPVPPRLSQKVRRGDGVQNLLILLVSLALCGMAIEACFIYRLYQPAKTKTSASFSRQIAGQDDTSTTEIPILVIPPSKPVAHLTDGLDAVHGKTIMAWSMEADPLLHEMDYRNMSLIIQKEGYYYVYSKVSFFNTDYFNHSIHRNTERYAGKSIPLLLSKQNGMHTTRRSNSYLGGVFHLTKNDAIYVEVRNTQNVVKHKPIENVFGAYMI
ncbi:tumor necrosis factor ligand superfamily member 14 [Notothenia coriiceps]|uniref:Tumor necrosis factor ligand superfamily member 14 n=1 Tax=Notothenia coriiceps TaxID=8208 RepID=A0A6I9N2U7_9TELE|nr:PREDICTED: tumor necrosis factor ligand superfamily member 14-like [Notothenia coriiceps]